MYKNIIKLHIFPWFQIVRSSLPHLSLRSHTPWPSTSHNVFLVLSCLLFSDDRWMVVENGMNAKKYGLNQEFVKTFLF